MRQNREYDKGQNPSAYHLACTCGWSHVATSYHSATLWRKMHKDEQQGAMALALGTAKRHEVTIERKDG